MAIYALGERVPDIHETAYVHPDAVVIGSVVLGPGSSVWPQAVIRGDDNTITVGEGSSIQDGSVLHCTPQIVTTVGNFCTIGHLAHLEGCTVLDHALVGSGAIVLHGAVIGRHALVGAAALVPGGMEVPERAMALGVPAKIRADALPEFHAKINVETYIRRAERFRSEMRRLD